MIDETERRTASATLAQHKALVKDCLRSVYVACLHGQRPHEMHLAALPAAIELIDAPPVPVLALPVDEPDAPASKPRDKAAKPANACTDGKRHKYGDDRKCGKCGAADPRAPKPANAEIPGVS